MRASLGHLQFEQLDNLVLDAWVRDHIKRRYQPGTINKHIFLLNRLLNMAKHWGFIDHNRFENRLIKRLPLGDYKQRFLSTDEIAAVLRSAEQDQHPFIHCIIKLLVLTGARSGEARLARWCDVDLHKRIWTVPVSRARVFYVNQRLERVLSRYWTVVRNPAPNGPLFQTQQGGHFSANTMSQLFLIIYSAAGLEGCSSHSGRRSFITRLADQGVAVHLLAALAGHRSIQTTQRYITVNDALLARAVELA